jgi:hypothetical protein
MTVIIDHHDVIDLMTDLETSLQATEVTESADHRRERDLKFMSDGKNGQRIENVVPARHAKSDAPELLPLVAGHKAGPPLPLPTSVA